MDKETDNYSNVLVIVVYRKLTWEDTNWIYRVLHLWDQADETQQRHFASLQECLEDAKKIMASTNISAVLAYTDMDALVYAALSQQFPTRLRGPSVESVFLSNHKYYSRRFLDPDPIPFTFMDLSLNLSDAKSLEQLCGEAINEVGLPAFFKPCSGTSSIGLASIRSSSDLFQAVKS